MVRPRDPRIHQRINQISHNIESANESAQEGLYTFSQNYISPCLAFIDNYVETCTAPCIQTRDGHLRRRHRGYTEAEANFDFYGDWHNAEEDDSLLGWNTGELDRLLAGSGRGHTTTEQPRRPRKMSYGTRHPKQEKLTRYIPDNQSDPTIIPSSSFFGFFERFPWRFSAKHVKYHPSAAGLQEHPGNSRRSAPEEGGPPTGAIEAGGGQFPHNWNGRDLIRSATGSLHGNSSPLSPRGDLFPSDEEEEDAVPLGDEFALAFSRHGTGLESDGRGSKLGIMRSVSGTSSLGDASPKNTEPFPPFPLPEYAGTSSRPGL